MVFRKAYVTNKDIFLLDCVNPCVSWCREVSLSVGHFHLQASVHSIVKALI